MTSHCRRAALILLFSALLTACYGFQVVVPSAVKRSHATSRRTVDTMMVEGNNADTKTEESTEATDIEVPKFDSKDFPQDTGSGPKFDWFSAVLVAYLIFAIADTVFHFTTEKSYIQAAMEAVTGSGGAQEGASSSP